MIKGAIDCDGVLADWTGSLFEEFPLDVPDNPPWDVVKLYDDPTKQKIYDRLADPEWWFNLSVMDGAKAGIAYLEGMGHELVYVTAPWDSCEGWEDARRAWLTKHFSVPPEKVFPYKDKWRVEAHYLIDDRPKNIEEYAEHHPRATSLLYDSPFNQNFAWPHRVTWATIRDVM